MLCVTLLTLAACSGGGDGGATIIGVDTTGSDTGGNTGGNAGGDTGGNAGGDTGGSAGGDADGDTGGDNGDGVVNNPPPTDEPDTSTLAALTIGRSNYETNCAECHGSDGISRFFPSIDADNCQIANCSSIDSLAGYIDMNMPLNEAQTCTIGGVDSCASTIAAYIFNDFTTGVTNVPVDPVDPVDPILPSDQSVPSPLARLTNDEYVNSVRTLLGLPGDSPQVSSARSKLVSESLVSGLTSDSVTQTLTQLAVSGYASLATAATNDFLDGYNSKSRLDIKMDCETLLEGIDTESPTRACVEEFSKNLISKAYRRPVNEIDAANITKLYDVINAFNREAERSATDFGAHRSVIHAIFQYIMLSPEFLLVVERGIADGGNAEARDLTDHEIATRMALFLAGTLPDDTLLAAADAGLLQDAEVRLQHAERMMNSDIGVSQFSTLIGNWLGIDESLAEISDIDAVRTFVTNWFVSEGPFSDLYQAPVSVQLLGGGQTSEPVGVLGLRAFVASHTSYPTPSFINRGVFVVERLLCEALPEDLPAGALDGEVGSPLDVFQNHAQQPCATCHKVFDNYGAAFQQFDAETSLFNPSFQEFGTSFNLFNIGDVNTSVSGVDDLGMTLGASQRASSCMTELWYRHFARRNVDTQGSDDLEIQTIMNSWAESDNQSMKSLLRSIVGSDIFTKLYL